MEHDLAGELQESSEYVPGSRRVEFYAEKLAPEHHIYIEEHHPGPKPRPYEYEEALLERLSIPKDFGMLLLVGGLGSGKSTAIGYLRHLLSSRRVEVQSAIGCSHCTVCLREPLVIDCIAEGREKPTQALVKHIFREIRFSIYDRLLRPWLLSGGLSISSVREKDPHLSTLRRLLLANDILSDVEHPFETPIDTSELLLGYKLRSKIPTEAYIDALLEKHAGAAARFGSELGALAAHESDAVDFMAQVLRVYMDHCKPGNPLNLIIIDNLDQLPTRRIDVVVKRLHDAASRAAGVPFLVALRPSSIVPDGFVRTLDSRYHYGPKNADVVAYRLWRKVLNKSRAELVRTRDKGGAFRETPGREELDAFLITAWLYFTIAKSASSESAWSRITSLEVHKDHDFLKQIDLSEDVSRSLAWTLEALTGTCTRYALREVNRFFQNSYRYPVVLSGLLRWLRSGHHQSVARGSYGDLVYLVVAHAPGATRVDQSIANVFLPTESGANAGTPSLIKLRILEALALSRRVRVKALVQDLCAFGIPTELSVAAVNDLQDRHRLLLWLSDNSRIENIEDGDEYAVISEHGLSYFESVVGDFELSWYSSLELNGQVVTPEALKFKHKLGAYIELIGKLVRVEWLQICFRRTLSRVFEAERGQLMGMPMVSAAVAFASLGRTLASVQLAIKGGRVRQDFLERLGVLLGKLLDVVENIEGQYKLAFGRVGLQSRYERQMNYILTTMDLLASQGSLPEDVSLRLKLLVKHWSQELTVNWNPADWLSKNSAPPEEDIVTTISRLGRGFDVLGSVVEVFDKKVESKILLRGIADKRERVAAMLTGGIPAYTELYNSLRFLLEDTAELESRLSDTAASGTRLFEWALREKDQLRTAVSVLGDLAISTPGFVGREEMTELKRRSNRILDIYRATAVHLGVVSVGHLEARWAV